MTHPLPSVHWLRVFKTVVVGGVVMKIPIEKTGKAAEVSQDRRAVG